MKLSVLFPSVRHRLWPLLAAILVLLLLTVGVFGCGGEEETTTSLEATTTSSAAPDSESTTSLATETTAASAEPVVVIDSLGNEVTIPAEVTKVASMREGITEIICALGQKDKIVAVEDGVKSGEGYGTFITSVYPDLMERDCPIQGSDVSAEEMLRIAPDLVLYGGFGRMKQAEALKEQAPELPVVIAHFETLEAYMSDVRIVAQCVGAEDKAEELVTFLEGKLAATTDMVKDVPEAEKVRVFFGGHDAYHAYGGETFEHSQTVAAGGVNVAEEMTGWMPEVSAEQLLVWDPQVIFLLSGVSVDDVLNDANLADLSAVKDKRVYALPESGWDFASPRALFAIEWIASKLYPEKFADVDIKAEADEFYQTLFSVDYSGPALD